MIEDYNSDAYIIKDFLISFNRFGLKTWVEISDGYSLPVPGNFYNAIKVILKERDALRGELDAIAKLIHYPDCWDTAAYPKLSDAMSGITEYYFKCTECATKEAE